MVLRWLELAALFYVLPLTLYFGRHLVGGFVIPVLLIVATVCLYSLIQDQSFDNATLTRVAEFKTHLLSLAIPLLIGGTILTFLTAMYWPELFISFPRRKPFSWILILFLYPILAALPQELIFRAFFFQRYRHLFSGNLTLIFFNGISFGLFHLFYANWYAPLLTIVGGWLFAYRYTASRSLLIVAFEHSVWGNFLFTTGLGWYFYHGSIQ